MTPRLLASFLAGILGLPAAVGAAQQATPVAEGSELLFSAEIAQEFLPDEAGPVYVARATYEPGDGEDLAPDNGLTVLAIETGTLTFNAEGPAALAGPEAGESAPKGACRRAPHRRRGLTPRRHRGDAGKRGPGHGNGGVHWALPGAGLRAPDADRGRRARR